MEKNNKHWSEEDTQYLIDNYKGGNREQIRGLITKLNRTAEAIQWKASKLGLSLPENYWTDKEISFLVNNRRRLTHQDIADQLGRTRPAITHKVQELKKKGLING